MRNTKFIKCGLYKPGHNTHFVQARVMRRKERFFAEVDLISQYSVRVITKTIDEVLYFHDSFNLHEKCRKAVDGDVQYSPESNLLYVKTKGPFRGTQGSWFIAYLSADKLTNCES